VTFLFETEVNQVDLEKGFLTSQSKNKEKINIQFKHLIAADGAYHPDADSKIKNRTVDKLLKNTIEYEKLFESKLQHFVSSYFRVKRKNDGMMDPPSKFLDVYLTQYGHDYIYYHYSSLKKSNGKQLKFYVTSCIPKEQEQIFKEDKEAGIKHLMSIAHMIFSEKQYDISPVKASLKHGLTKDNLKYQIFSRVFYRAKMPGINQNGHYLLAIGDAALSPDFFQGIGTNAAILTGTLATNVILGTISLEGYNKILKERAKQQKTSSKEIEMKFKENWQKMTEEEFEEKTSPKVRDLQIQLEEKIDDVQLLKDRDRLFLKSKTTKSIYDDDLEILKIYLKVITDNKSNIKKIAAEWQKLQAALQNTGSDSRFFKKQISSGIKEFLKQIEGIALQHAKEYKEGDQNRRFRIL
jgi:hypothetical protein